MLLYVDRYIVTDVSKERAFKSQNPFSSLHIINLKRQSSL